jgi:uncharacterized protein (DUF433 family)
MAGVIIRDPEIWGGEPVFRGTRVPFKVLTDYLEGGDTVDQFLEQYPSVRRELTIAATPLLVPFAVILLGLNHYRKNLLAMDKELIFEELQND